jgi:hypothetical protein
MVLSMHPESSVRLVERLHLSATMMPYKRIMLQACVYNLQEGASCFTRATVTCACTAAYVVLGYPQQMLNILVQRAFQMLQECH